MTAQSPMNTQQNRKHQKPEYQELRRSERLQKILDTRPSFILRWGTAILAAIAIAIILIVRFIMV